MIPPEANQTIYVLGASGFGRPIRETVHRPERYAELAGEVQDTVVTPEIAAVVLERESLYDKIYVNQIDLLSEVDPVRQLACLVRGPVVAGSLWKGEYFVC